MTKTFINKMDKNPYIYCVLIIMLLILRIRYIEPGQPDDYISKCTNIDYIEFDRTHE